jgi:8-oxo-dGTP diphosphatase
VAELSTVVQAAGGVVWRRVAPDAALEIVLVHRPRYDDWSLPKGKLEPGEHRLVAAVREVFEETAVRATPQVRLPSVRYLTGAPGVDKRVDFWSMRAESWTPREPDDEIEELRWIPATAASSLLSYVHDRGVVKAFLDLPPLSGIVALVRHAYAGRRRDWDGTDEDRPLAASGEADAVVLGGLLRLFAPTAVLSATPLRCRQTVAPLEMPIALDPAFDEGAPAERAATVLRELASDGGMTVVASQGKLIPPLLAALTGRTNLEFATAKGSGWILSFSGGRLINHDHLDLS